jgi:von Willebrand factor type A domain
MLPYKRDDRTAIMKLQQGLFLSAKFALVGAVIANFLLGASPTVWASIESIVVVVLDDSGSMRQRMQTDQGALQRIEVAKNALSRVVTQLPDNTQLGILLLNQNQRGNRWLVPLGPLDIKRCLASIQKIRADGGTPLGASIKTATDALLEARQRKVYGNFRLLVVTDGEATDADLLANYLPDVLSRGITLDVIGVDMSADHSLAGRAHSYRRAGDAASLENALREVFAESSSPQDFVDDQNNNISLLEGLPDDDDFVKEILAALSTTSNKEINSATHSIGFVAPNSTAPAPINSPTVPSNPAADGLLSVLAMLPCCLSLLIVFILITVIIKSKSQSKRPRR